MIEYRRFPTGRWQASCQTCGQQIITDTVDEAYTRGRTHEKVCGR